MTFSRMEAAMEDAFTEWFNMFSCKSHPIDTVVELADGVILSEILADIDNKWFKKVSPPGEAGDGWVQRLNNQKLIYNNITRYMEDALGQDPELLPSIDLTAIAKDADMQQLLLMCQLIVAIAVQSDHNHRYIDMIQSLTQKSQHALMVSIEEVMRHLNGDDLARSSRLSGTSSTTASRSIYTDSDPRMLDAERVISEKKQLEGVHVQLVQDYEELRERFEMILDEKDELNARLRDMDAAIAQANDTGQADSVMRAELEHVKQDLARSEDKRAELEQQCEQQVHETRDLQRRMDDLATKADEANLLRDQLAEYEQTIERMHKMETVLAKYKAKAEESIDLRRHIKALEEQNTSLLEKSHQVEDEYRKVLAFKTLMDSYKEQVQQLEASNLEILKEKNRLGAQVASLAQQCEYLEEERNRNVEQVQLLEDQIREMEFVTNNNTLDDEVVSHDGSVTLDDQEKEEHVSASIAPSTTVHSGTPPSLANDFEENMKKSNITELRLTITRLKRKVKELEASKGTSDQETELTAVQQAKNQLEKDHEQIKIQRDELQQQLKQIRNGIPDSLMNQTQTIMAVRSRILDLEKESAFLKTEILQLESTVDQGTRSVAKDKTASAQYEKDHARLQERLNRLEDITKMQLHDINRMLVEANYLNGINNQPLAPTEDNDTNDMDDKTRGLSDEDLEVIKEQNANLQIHVLHLQEEINETQGKTRKVRDMIKLYNQLLQEMAARFSNSRSSDEPASLISRAPRTKDEEYDLLRKQIHDVRVQSKREQQLVVSAWYDLAKRNHKEWTHLSSRSTPSSWLGRQRKLLDNQLRQKLC